MASRRMFSKAVVNTARFLRMPSSSRLLYYDLGMAADDDGVAEAFGVMRMTGASEDDLRMLAAKGFVKVLNDDLVTLITDWKVNNSIRQDRYQPGIYCELVKSLAGQPSGNQLTTICQPSDNQPTTEVRVDKERILPLPIDKEKRVHLSARDLRIRDIIRMDAEKGTGKTIKDDDPIMFAEMLSGRYPMELVSAAISETERMLESGRDLDRPIYYMQKLLTIWHDEGITSATELEHRH